MYDGNGGAQTSCWRQLYDWWIQVPLHTNALFWLVNILYMTSSLLVYLPYELALFPYFLFQGQIWRIFTGPFVFFGLYSLILGLFLFMPLAAKRERELGTVRYTFMFMLNSTLVALFLSAITGIFSSVFGYKALEGVYVMGTLPLYMIELVIDCQRDSELPRNFLGCIQLRAKYVPWAVLLLFSFISRGLISFNMITGLLVGHLHSRGLLKKLYVRASTAHQLEQSILFYSPATARSFAKVGDDDDDSFDEDAMNYLQRMDYPVHNTDESEMMNNIENMDSEFDDNSGEEFFAEPRDNRGIELAPR